MENENKKILIVEDDEDFIFLLKEGFSKENFSMFYAKDGEEGLAMAEKEKPDLIIADILMPKMDGITMAKNIKEKGINSLIMFLTNFNDTEHIGEAVEVIKNTDYIIKSDIHIDQVVAMVKAKLGVK